jgi:hypothetical protein
MSNKLLSRCMGMVISASCALSAQLVEKTSASFSFPTAAAVMPGGSTLHEPASMFRAGANFFHKSEIVFEWSVNSNASSGEIRLFSISGACLKKIPLTAAGGSAHYDSKGIAAGVYFAAISYGAFRRTLTLVAARYGEP